MDKSVSIIFTMGIRMAAQIIFHTELFRVREVQPVSEMPVKTVFFSAYLERFGEEIIIFLQSSTESPLRRKAIYCKSKIGF